VLVRCARLGVARAGMARCGRASWSLRCGGIGLSARWVCERRVRSRVARDEPATVGVALSGTWRA
jgi:hypothetical protein